MARASGFAVLLPKDRTTAFLECVAEEQPFAEPVTDFNHSRNVPLVCFIVGARKVTHIGLGRRGTRAGTGLRRLNLRQVEKLAEPLSVQRIINRLPKRNAVSVRKRLTFGGLLTDTLGWRWGFVFTTSLFAVVGSLLYVELRRQNAAKPWRG